MFEGDCLKVISTSNSTTLVGDKLHSIIFDIRELLQQTPGWTLLFSYREANKAANALAKLACNLAKNVVWMENCPFSVVVFIKEDKLCNLVVDE